MIRRKGGWRVYSTRHLTVRPLNQCRWFLAEPGADFCPLVEPYAPHAIHYRQAIEWAEAKRSRALAVEYRRAA